MVEDECEGEAHADATLTLDKFRFRPHRTLTSYIKFDSMRITKMAEGEAQTPARMSVSLRGVQQGGEGSH